MQRTTIFRSLIGLFSLLVILSCQEQKQEQIRAVYFWRSADKVLSKAEKEFLVAQDVKRIYVKAFEVDFDKNKVVSPISKNRLAVGQLGQNVEIVPTIFIRHEVFKNRNNDAIDSLANQVFRYLCNMDFGFENLGSTSKNATREIQLDCDWTSTTKDAFFQFVRTFRTISGAKLSCTLRLYPYKYPQNMGVPPVDRVMLMCYNLLEPLNSPQKNTILDIDELKSYINKQNTYPLPIDLALPLYSWIQIYQYGKFSGLSYDLDILQTQAVRKINDLWYEVLEDTYLGEQFIRAGDRLKVEIIDKQTVESAIAVLLKHFDWKHSTISFFHLDEYQLKSFEADEIAHFYSRFSPN